MMPTLARAPRRDPAALDIAARVAQLEIQVAQIRALLEAGRGPRDSQDVAVLSAVALAAGSATFTSRDVFRHRAVDPALRDALEAADVDNARQLGRLLRRMAGEHDGYRLACVGEGRDGLRWRVSRV
jgi:hypothetical protein